MAKQDPSKCEWLDDDGNCALKEEPGIGDTVWVTPCHVPTTGFICPDFTLKTNKMKILLKDPSLVDAVIKKITDKFPCHYDAFLKYGVECLKEKASKSNPMLLEVGWGWNVEHQDIESTFKYTRLKEIPTDQDFLNDKEW